VEILVSTAKETGGICMPCKNGAPPEWLRQRLWKQHGMDPLGEIRWQHSPWTDEILATCQKTIAGEIGCIEASRTLAALAENIFPGHGEKWVHKDWEIFEEVNCATSQIPFGQARERWSDDALRTKDKELQTIENLYSKRVLAAMQKLLEDAKQF
jgi:hypothetical protein